MPSWKKILISGSSAEITNITASVVPTGTSENVVLVDSSGRFKQITQGALSTALGQYSFTGSADSGTSAGINNNDTFKITGGGGITTSFAKVGTTGSATINVNSSSMATYFRQDAYANISGDITINPSGVSAIGSSKVTSAMIVDGTIIGSDIASNTITNSNLVNSTISGIALGSNLNSHTAGSGLSGSSYNGSSPQTWTVDSGSMLPFYSSSTFTRVSGDITITAGGVAAIGSSKVTNAMLVSSSIYIAAGNGLTGDGSTALGATASLAVGAGSGIAVATDSVALKNAGSLTGNVVTKWDSGNTQLVNSIISDDGTTATVSGFLNANRITSIGAITGSAISASGNLTGQTINSATTITANGNITANNGNILSPTGFVKSGNPSPAGSGLVGNVEGQLGWFNTLTSTGDLTVLGNATVTGNLTVAGTASFTNSTSLLIADKFALLASGSTSLTDGGIIIQNTAGGIGTAFYLEAGAAGSTGTYGRFAITGSLASDATTTTADEFFVTAKTNTGAPVNAPTFGGSSAGYGNIYVNSTNGDIFIYS